MSLWVLMIPKFYSNSKVLGLDVPIFLFFFFPGSGPISALYFRDPPLFSLYTLHWLSFASQTTVHSGTKDIAASLVWGFAVLFKQLGSYPWVSSAPSCSR